ncbi:phosphatidylinositol glycan anchor biosynthesis class U protein [Toxorhynchites rutilus septentrionalis]|uniref:phosphatidylinositol glycan anchor biosynthesis class U protein n=1 Tax=Toxorhynchites rutilus septentrionalis TaxID=329112 RepID=UPI00247A3894|nr:phosphatidylinositol glycan anchor biosynthesis class U protein [Toxorhynchites rutilus septentrionalis]
MKWYISITLGAAVRYMLMNSDYAVTIQNRVEVATPLNSWKRAVEGAYLYANGTNPYDSDLYHQNALVLVSVWYLFQQAASIIAMTFIQLEVGTILMLKVAAAVFIKELYSKQLKRSRSFAKGTKELQISKDDLEYIPYYVALAYMFNPYSILNCVGQTTTVLSNFLLALFLLGTSYRLRIIACVALALETQINIYPCVLIIPSALFIAEHDKNKTLSIIATCLTFLLAFLAVNGAAFGIIGDWSFLDATYGFILNSRDLQPNIGLFWYFFTEMFDHFRTLFLCTFQINATVLYLFPLTFKLHKEPIMLMTMLLALGVVFRPYPCVGDISMYLSLLPLWKSISKFMGHNFIVGATMLVTSVLGPTVWHLWIYSNSANANFYFGVTLVFCTAQIFLITDLFFAYIKREFCLKNGMHITIDGKEARIALE